MRVCDITKSEQVKARFVIHEVPLDWDAAALDFGQDTSKVHDFEVGESAAAAITKGNWRGLYQLTPPADRPKDPGRSEAAKKAGVTRTANKEKAAREAAEAAKTETVEG